MRVVPLIARTAQGIHVVVPFTRSPEFLRGRRSTQGARQRYQNGSRRIRFRWKNGETKLRDSREE